MFCISAIARAHSPPQNWAALSEMGLIFTRPVQNCYSHFPCVRISRDLSTRREINAAAARVGRPIRRTPELHLGESEPLHYIYSI